MLCAYAVFLVYKCPWVGCEMSVGWMRNVRECANNVRDGAIRCVQCHCVVCLVVAAAALLTTILMIMMMMLMMMMM